MDVTRRNFLRISFSGAASLLAQRYASVMKLLKSPAHIVGNSNKLSPKLLNSYFSLFEGTNFWLGGHDAETGFALGDSLIFSIDDHFTLSDLPNMSQPALLRAYEATVNNFQAFTEHALYLYKYGDDIGPIHKFLSDNLEKITLHEDEFGGLDNSYKTHLLAKSFNTPEKFKDCIKQIIKEHQRHLNAIRTHLTAESLDTLSQKTFIRLIGTNKTIPYNFSFDNIGDVIETISLRENGVCIGKFDISDTFRPLLDRAAKSDEAKETIARRILSWDEGFYNFDLAQEHGLKERHFKTAIRTIVKEKADLNAYNIQNNADMMEDYLYETKINPAQISDDLDFIEHEILSGRLKFEKTRSFEKGGGLYRIYFDPVGVLDERTDRLLDAICPILAPYGYLMEQKSDGTVVILIGPKSETYFKHAYFLDNYCRQTETAASFTNAFVSSFFDDAELERRSINEMVHEARQRGLFPY